MPKSKKRKERKRTSKPTDILDPLRQGMPARDSIREVAEFVPPHQNATYRIIKTTETDAYDPVPKPRKKRGSKS